MRNSASSASEALECFAHLKVSQESPQIHEESSFFEEGCLY